MEITECGRAYEGAVGDVTISVTVGEGHKGRIDVYLDWDLVDGAPDELKDLSLGTAEDLRGRLIRVLTRVEPVNFQSDRSSVRHVLRSGGAHLTLDCNGPSPEEGEPIQFEAKFDVV